jgi:hypothetical protein
VIYHLAISACCDLAGRMRVFDPHSPVSNWLTLQRSGWLLVAFGCISAVRRLTNSCFTWSS